MMMMNKLICVGFEEEEEADMVWFLVGMVMKKIDEMDEYGVLNQLIFLNISFFFIKSICDLNYFFVIYLLFNSLKKIFII